MTVGLRLPWILLLAALGTEASAAPDSEETTRVACLGDERTLGTGLPDPRLAWPELLQARLGDRFAVRSFGAESVGWTAGELGTTLEGLATFHPEVVLIALGTHDAAKDASQEDILAKARALVGEIRRASALARIVLLIPSPEPGRPSLDVGLQEVVGPALRQVAFETRCGVLDLHRSLQSDAHRWARGPRPHPFEADAIAARVAEHLLLDVDPPFDLATHLPEPTRVTSFHGFRCLELTMDDVACRIVLPERAAEGHPWIWRARFFGHEPQLDVALLERGWHVAYCDVAGLYGSPTAVARWERFYDRVVSAGLDERPILEGMSRGGLIITAWAVAHPERVAGLYGDAPVLDIRSWPGGRGQGKGSAGDWKACLAAWELTEETVTDFRGLPIDRLEGLAKAGVPILNVVGEADDVVPVAENSDLLEKRYRELGGTIQVIRKPGVGHHPHSLEDPEPLVRFALAATGRWKPPATIAAPSAEYRGGAAGWGGGIWLDQHDKILAAAAARPGLRLVFLGDSITQSWTGSGDRLSRVDGARPFDRFFAPFDAASFGISGDRTEHVLWRIDHGEFEGIDPEVIVLMIGVNNINAAQHDGASVAAGTLEIVARLREREAQATLLVLGCFPTGARDSAARHQVDLLHEILVEQVRGDARVRYLDLRSHFLTESGELHPKRMAGDGIHLAGPGYEAWGEALLPVLHELLGDG